MGWFSDDSEQATNAQTYANTDDKASLSHEVIAGAASFEAARAWEQHEASEGKPQSYALAKELIAGTVGAFVDREAETAGWSEAKKLLAKKKATDDALTAAVPPGTYDDQPQ